jgi:NADH-quinone oxidoreductase subunit J
VNTVFFVSAAVAVLATVMVITRSNAVHALLYLVVSFLAVAVMFFVLGAALVAALEVIVYAGAIMVLFVFVVMMLGHAPGPPGKGPWRTFKAWAGPAVLSLVLLAEFVYVLARGGPAAGAVIGSGPGPSPIAPKAVGASLFSTYLLGVELAAMLLLAAVVGAFHLGGERTRPRHRFFEGEEAK